MKQKTENLQVRFTESEFHEGKMHIFIRSKDLPDTWLQNSFLIIKSINSYKIICGIKEGLRYYDNGISDRIYDDKIYEGKLSECKEYMRQMVIREKFDHRYMQIKIIKYQEKNGSINSKKAEKSISKIIAKYELDCSGKLITDNPILAKMSIPPEGGLDNLIRNPKDFLQIIRITDTDDFKRCLKYLADQFPEEYGKDSVKIAGEIFRNVGHHSYENIQTSLKEADCTTPEKTRQVLDKWAGFDLELTVKQRNHYIGMER